MAHFARLDENNVVIEVTVVNNNDILDENGNESEEVGSKRLENLHGGRWVQTSYNSNFRHRYAGIGMVYNEKHDVFTHSQPYPSWVFDTENYTWNPPTPYPQNEEGKNYMWNEINQQWVEIN